MKNVWAEAPAYPRPVDTVNIWYSPTIQLWNVCALIPRTEGRDEGLTRDKHSFSSFEEAVAFAQKAYRSPELPSPGCGE